MPRIALLLLALALGAISAGALVACGSDDGTIPEENAAVMLSALAAASAADAAGDCDAVQTSATEVSDEAAASLPSDVDPEVRQAVIDGAEQLFELAGASGACGGGEADRDTTRTKETTTSSTTTSTTEATTSTTTEPTTAPPQPPDEGDGNLGEGNSGGVPPDVGSGGTGGG